MEQEPMPLTAPPPMAPPVPSTYSGRRRKHAHADQYHQHPHHHQHQSLRFDYDFEEGCVNKNRHDYSYDLSKEEGSRQRQPDDDDSDVLRGQTNGYSRTLCGRDPPFTWTKEDSWLTQALLTLRLIYIKKVNSEASPSLTEKRTKTKSSSKPKSKPKSRLKTKSRMTKPRFLKEEVRSSPERTPTPTSVPGKPRSKLLHRGKKKFKSRIKRQWEKLDVNSAQYRLFHSDHSKLRRISRAELSKHILPSLAHINKVRLNEKPDGIWMLIHGFVFDIANLLDHHPGGAECLLDCAGVDATRVFDDVGHSDIAWEMLENCCVGIIEDFESSDEGEEGEGQEQGEEEEVEDEEEALQDVGEAAETINANRDEISGTVDAGEDEEITKETQVGDVETGNCYATAELVWNKRALEYLVIIVCALFGLCCFIVLQRMKWETWEEIDI